MISLFFVALSIDTHIYTHIDIGSTFIPVIFRLYTKNWLAHGCIFYLFLCTCIYIYTYTCVIIYIHIQTFVYIYIHTYIHTFVRVYIYISIYTCMYIQYKHHFWLFHCPLSSESLCRMLSFTEVRLCLGGDRGQSHVSWWRSVTLEDHLMGRNW